ncbi:hypothetical protein [Streptomyces sp. NPDC002088]|uniref:hypothetical protein n=1 Tax=Streptomyces sp. NPDC002088 TaxID=3154665 RepID=UPI00331BF727
MINKLIALLARKQLRKRNAMISELDETCMRLRTKLARSEKRCDELRAESLRRGKAKGEYAERIRGLEAAIARVQALHRETCPVARGRVATGFTCSMCDTLDQPAPDPELRRQLATATYTLTQCEAALARMRGRTEVANVRLERAEAALAQVQALAAAHPVTIDTALILAALDIPPRPAATEPPLLLPHDTATTLHRTLGQLLGDEDAQAIDRLRALHREEYGSCAECTHEYGVPYPCPTIRALDGEEQP